MVNIACDFADPSAPAIDSAGRRVPKRFKIQGEADEDGIRRLAEDAARRGDEAQAQYLAERIGSTLPLRVQAGFFEKPVSNAIFLGSMAALGVGIGATMGIRALVRRSRLKKMEGAKVVRMR